MSPATLRRTTVLSLLAGDALALLAWSQTWVDLRVDGRATEVPGSVAGGAVLAFALTGVTLALATLIAGPVARVVLGVLQVAVGACLAAATGIAIADPLGSAGPVLAAATGLTGPAARRSVEAVALTAWPVTALVAGIALALLGVLLAVGGPRWPRGGRRFERSRTTAADASSSDTIAEWDALSRGADPTEADARADDTAGTAGPDGVDDRADPDDAGRGPEGRGAPG